MRSRNGLATHRFNGDDWLFQCGSTPQPIKLRDIDSIQSRDESPDAATPLRCRKSQQACCRDTTLLILSACQICQSVYIYIYRVIDWFNHYQNPQTKNKNAEQKNIKMALDDNLTRYTQEVFAPYPSYSHRFTP